MSRVRNFLKVCSTKKLQLQQVAVTDCETGFPLTRNFSTCTISDCNILGRGLRLGSAATETTAAAINPNREDNYIQKRHLNCFTSLTFNINTNTRSSNSNDANQPKPQSLLCSRHKLLNVSSQVPVQYQYQSHRPVSTSRWDYEMHYPTLSRKSGEHGDALKSMPKRSVVTSQKVAEIGKGRMEEPKLLSKEEREEFMSMFPQLMRDLTEIPEYRDMPETNRWLTRVLQYNVPHGKRNRGLATALAYRYLTTSSELTEENVKLSYVLGWCVEMLQAYFLVADDIMDDSETRRGRPCWYKVDNLGATACNDAFFLQSSVFVLLKKYFGHKKYYTEILDVMHDVNHKTIFGQSLDTRTGLERKLESYTIDRYSAIVKYKTSFYSFYLPVRLAMCMAGITDAEAIQQVRTVTLEMGHFFQVQDDYLDCFGDIEVTGKIGTDIQDCKCSWLFVVASQKCSSDQMKVLKENYGKNEPDKIERVKQLYLEIGIPETYNAYEEQTYNLICTHIQQMTSKLPKHLFVEMVNKIYRRNG